MKIITLNIYIMLNNNEKSYVPLIDSQKIASGDPGLCGVYTNNYAQLSEVSGINCSPNAKINVEKYNTEYIVFKSLEEKYISTDDNDIKMKYNPFSINKIQKYNPIPSLFLDVSKHF